MSERIYIDENEWYPVCSITDQDETACLVDAPDGFSARWEAAYAEFSACQDVMRALIATEPDPVPLPEPGDSILELDDEHAGKIKAGDVVLLGDDNERMLVVSVSGASLRMRPWVPA